MRVSHLPGDERLAGWNNTSSRPISFPEYSGTSTARCVVVGAGFSGVAAARRLAELRPDSEVILIDAVGIGQGSAGRSSGFVVSIGHFNNSSTSINRRIFQLGCAGIESLRALVERFQIDCQWNEAGRLIGTSTPAANRTLSQICRVLDRIEASYERLGGESVRAMTGMVGVQSAIRQIDSVLIQPAALLRGLIENLPANVNVFENSPVVRIETGGRIVVECDGGTVRAETLILTTNGHLPSFGQACHRVFPMRTFASHATPQNRPTGRDVDQTEWGYTSAERVGSSFRRLWNGQYLIRNSACYGLQSSDSESELRLKSAVHQETLAQRFPDLAPWKIDQTWSGVIGITANSASYFANPQENVFMVGGHNGHGISHGTIAGELLAEWSLGIDSQRLADIRSLPSPNWIPNGPPLKAGVAVAMGYLNWRFRGER